MSALLLWTALGYLSGAIPVSPLIGRLALRRDITRVGDGNPGATNVLRAGGWAWGALALLLDITKGALPVGIAWELLGITDWRAVPIALAPALGHACSPCLGWRGGKAIATTFGIWLGVSLGLLALVLMVALLACHALTRNGGWAITGAMLGLGGYLALLQPEPVLLALWTCSLALLLWTHRRELRQRPALRGWRT